jgi:hypothetical protein
LQKQERNKLLDNKASKKMRHDRHERGGPAGCLSVYCQLVVVTWTGRVSLSTAQALIWSDQQKAWRNSAWTKHTPWHWDNEPARHQAAIEGMFLTNDLLLYL